MVENRRPILSAEVRALAVQLRGIMILPEDIQQGFVRSLCRIVVNLNCFRMSCAVGADVFIRRILHLAAGVANTGACHTRNLPKCCFDAPEASSSKCRFRHELLPSA